MSVARAQCQASRGSVQLAALVACVALAWACVSPENLTGGDAAVDVTTHPDGGHGAHAGDATTGDARHSGNGDSATDARRAGDSGHAPSDTGSDAGRDAGPGPEITIYGAAGTFAGLLEAGVLDGGETYATASNLYPAKAAVSGGALWVPIEQFIVPSPADASAWIFDPPEVLAQFLFRIDLGQLGGSSTWTVTTPGDAGCP